MSTDPGLRSHRVRIVRDIVEIVAILAAGFWAFYVFVYENRIKPSFSDPQVSVGATLEKTSQSGGAVGVLLKTNIRNEGSVRFDFAGYYVTVLATRMTLSTRPLPPVRSDTSQTQSTYFTLSKSEPVYGFGFITSIGNPASKYGLQLEPGGDVSQEHTFYIPAGRFDVLTAHVDGCFTRNADRVIPVHLRRRSDGTTGVTCDGGLHVAFDVGSLDLRK